MHYKINQLITSAILAIRKAGIADNDNQVAKEYNGYIASMGSSIIQSGLLPTLAFFSKGENKKKDSSQLLDAIFLLIRPDEYKQGGLIPYIIENTKKIKNGESVAFENLDWKELTLIEEEIEQALIALKLALRTFKLIES